MKITPISGPSLGSISTGTVSPDRKEAAKQAFLGDSGVKISPSDTSIDPQVERAQANIRKIKMRTNFSTNRDEASVIEDTIEESATPSDSVQAPTTEVTQPISPQLAAIAKQRRALQVKESEIAAREKALSEQSGNTLDLSKLKANPLGVLQQAGVTYEQLTEAILSDQSGSNPDIQALKAQVEALEKGFETKLTERDSQAEQQVLSELRRETDKLVAQGDDFEMIREMHKQPAVTDLIHRTWKQTGEVLDVTEAAALVENQLVDDYSKLASLKKIQSKFTPAEVQSPVAQGSHRQMRTLTNRDTASVPMSKRARAIAAMNGTLKK